MKDISLYTRVTEVLFPLSGLKGIPAEVLKKAAERGTKVHEICDAIMSDLGFFWTSTDQKLLGYIQSFNQWLPKSFIDKPDRFYCDDIMLTGECDRIYEDYGDLVLIDIKTPAKESKTWRLQASAYSYLAKKSGYNISRIEFIKLDKEGKFPEVLTYKEDMEMFLKCLDVHRHFHKNSKDENPLDFL